MKQILFIFYLFYFYNCSSQELINPYADYDGHTVTDLNYNTPTIIFSYNNAVPFIRYNGEYEILLDKFPWGNSDSRWAQSFARTRTLIKIKKI